MIKSNVLKDVPYPEEFNDDDKEEYNRLFSEAKLLHEDVFQSEPWILHLAIIAHIRTKKGMVYPITDDELMALKDKYSLKVKEVKCEGNEIDYLYDKEKNPMFFPNESLFEYTSNVIDTPPIEDKVIISLDNNNNINNK